MAITLDRRDVLADEAEELRVIIRQLEAWQHRVIGTPGTIQDAIASHKDQLVNLANEIDPDY